MGLIYSGNVGMANFSGEDIRSVLDSIASFLGGKGWTVIGYKARGILRVNGLPSADWDAWFDGVSYTFVNVAPTLPNQIRIGANNTEMALNIVRTLMGSGTPGTHYGPGSTVSANFDVSIDPVTATDIRVVAKLAGCAAMRTTWSPAKVSWGGNTFQLISDTGITQTGAVVVTGIFDNGGYTLFAAESPHGLVGGMSCKITRTDVATNGYMRLFSHGGKIPNYWADDRGRLAQAVGRQYTIIGSKYQFAVYAQNNFAISSIHDELFFSVPYLIDKTVPLRVASVANAGGLIKVATQTAHGLTTGDVVYIDSIKWVTAGWEHSVNSAVQTITVVSGTEFTVDGSAFPVDTHVANTGVVARWGREVGRAILFGFRKSGASAYTGSFRFGPAWRSVATGGAGFGSAPCVMNYVNEALISPPMGVNNENSQNWISLAFLGVLSSTDATFKATRPFGSGSLGNVIEPRVAVKLDLINGNRAFSLGTLYDSFVATTSYPGDSIKENYDGHDWIAYTNANSVANLWLAYTPGG